jgi:hypothetical protein
LGKKNELQAVEAAIEASLGKRKAEVEGKSQGVGEKVRGKEIGRDSFEELSREHKAGSR